MKVLLINPPSFNEILSCNPEIIKEERGYDPPLGLLYIGSYLKKYSANEIKIIDAQVDKLSYQELQNQIKEYAPDVIGITAMTLTMYDVLETIRLAKEAVPKAKIVLGGPHPHIYPEETINLANIDFVVLGEGELTFFHLLKNLDNPEKLREVSGLVFKHNGEIINTGYKEFCRDLDSLPFPDRSLVPYQKYSSLLSKENPITTMFTSRGCPYQCTFCDRPNMGKIFRSRSANNVVDEMEECLKLGIKEIFIYDDTFTIDRRRVIDICQEILKRELKFGWDIRARVNTVDEEMLKLLKQAGCIRVHYGVESGTDKILKVLNKNITLDQAKKAFKITRKLGMETLAYFIIGSPTETRQDILTTINFAKKLNPNFAQITILTPFPATKIYDQALAEGIYATDYWREFAKNPYPGFKTRYWTRELGEEELKQLTTLFYKKFYLRPSYIIKQLLKVKSGNELGKKIKAGLKIIFKKNEV